MKVSIKNCNCISEAQIQLQPNSLNIKYGVNGTGKSTISNAIFAKSKNSDLELNKLQSYYTSELPCVDFSNFSKVSVFNEDYVNSYLFEESSFLNNSYQVFLHSDEFDILSHQTTKLLENLQEEFLETDNIKRLREYLPTYSQITKFENGQIPKRGGMGELLKGQGAGFEKYSELESYKAYYDRDLPLVSSWAKWRNDGTKQMNGQLCPFCTHETEESKMLQQNKIIEKVFKSSALVSVNSILEFLKIGIDNDYICNDAISVLKSYVGDGTKSAELHSEMTQLGIETDYLYNKIERICSFKPLSVTREQLEQIEISLDNLIIDRRQISKFYATDLILKLVKDLEDIISILKGKTIELRASFGKCQRKIEKLIQNRKEDINDFFSIAGFPYQFILKSDGEEKAVTYLAPINLDETKIENIENRLSWGEKNAFSLVMFMFESVSNGADFIVLDDPITSFDKHKKFAVMKRLFDNQKLSFRDKTVLMLTHDLHPVIDHIHGEFFKKFGLTTPVFANYLINDNGSLKEYEILKDDLLNAVELTKKLAKDDENPLTVRIVNLRKYIELTEPNYSLTAMYDVLSNIIHGRDLTNYVNKIEEQPTSASTIEIIEEGLRHINEFIPNLSYDDFIEKTSDYELKTLVDDENMYNKILAIRFLFEKDRPTKSLLSVLRKKYPSACKFVNETNHVENDYIFQLNPLKFIEVPSYFLNQLEKFLHEERIL